MADGVVIADAAFGCLPLVHASLEVAAEAVSLMQRLTQWLLYLDIAIVIVRSNSRSPDLLSQKLMDTH